MKKIITIALTFTALTSHAMSANDKARALEKLNAARSEMQSVRSLIPKVYRPIVDNNLKNASQKIEEVFAIVTTSRTDEDYNQQVPLYPPSHSCNESLLFVKTKCDFFYRSDKYASLGDVKNFEILAQGNNIAIAQNNLWQEIDKMKSKVSAAWKDCTPMKVVDSYGREIQ